ncbi:GntR family transcriptional regulator [Acidisphaera sp. S103]|uniref:GntR family transcriptional regulator n=1 Tax=Acidisphaera sp. S103 TaxID=1747223 RepID=UPI00131DFB92|nr:GntR family transcriptional regulator [Acidisphaera sp. S103]
MLLRDRVYQLLRDAILTCEFQPGQELREQVLAERYHVSRSPIRDSLLRLEQEKLVTVLPRQGYRVNPISMSDVEDIFGLRLLIEPACAAAAARADDAALQALDRFRGIADKERTESEFLEYNRAFHRAVIDLSGNARMAAIAVELDEQFQRLMRLSLQAFDYERVRPVFGDHEAIIDALQAHDADLASRLSYQHAARAHARISDAMRDIEQQQAKPPTPKE